jgi:FixJ family two-component response regulator
VDHEVAPRRDRLPKDIWLLRRSPLISVIDDDESFRVATDSLLRARGYVVHTFSSAPEFLRSPQLDETSCLITDLQMPDVSGLELQTLLRNQGRTVPMIFVTAFPDESARLRALRDGAICFLSKTSDAATLMRCVEAALAGRNPTNP